MAITRPSTEQIRFTSSKTGTHVLDTYLEACEFGSRNIYDILGDIFDSSTGLVDSDSFQLKIDSSTRSLQTRMGTFSNPAASWTNVDGGYIFRQRGAHANATAYEQLDVVTYNNGTYVCKTAHTSSAATPSGTNFVTILDGTALGTATTSATASAATATTQATTATTQATAAAASAVTATNYATKINGAVTGTDYSAKAWSIGGTGIDNTALRGSAKDWATKTGATVDGTNYSAKHWATQADVVTVATNIADITAVAGKATQIGLLGTADAVTDMNTLGTADVVADMNTLGTADVVADMNTLAIADVVADMNTLAVADVIADMNTLGTADIVADMNLLGTTSNVAAMALLGTSDAVADMNTLGTAAVVADLNILGTADVVADMNTLATADVVADMNTLGTADVVTDMNTLGTADVVTDMNVLGTAGNVTAMNTLGTATNVTNMASVAANITGVNSFADKYRVQASAPSSSLDDGDLWYDTANDAMKVYNGTNWVSSAGFASFVISDMTDVTVTSVADNEVLAWDSSSSKWINQTPSEASIDVSDLADTTITSVADNEVLAYDNSSSKWINQTAAESGLATSAHNHTGTYEAANANIQSHIADADKHGEIDDAATGATDLWSASKINTVTSGNTTLISANTAAIATNTAAISTNTAKVTNATHTGDVTGSTTLTIATDAVDIAMLSATGTASATTFLRGDNTWTAVDALPSQSGNAGKYLTTNATTASWATLDTDANTTTKGLYEHEHTIDANYSIANGSNALSAGPITIDTGNSVTVPTGSTWVIV